MYIYTQHVIYIFMFPTHNKVDSSLIINVYQILMLFSV